MTRSDLPFVTSWTAVRRPNAFRCRVAGVLGVAVWVGGGAAVAALLGAGMYAAGGVWSAECVRALTAPVLAGAVAGGAGAVLTKA